MLRTRSIRRLLVAALFATYAALPGGRLHAYSSHDYDLDSLVHLSKEVAEVEITRRFRVRNIDLIEATVMLVHKGRFKKGQVVAVWAPTITENRKRTIKRNHWQSVIAWRFLSSKPDQSSTSTSPKT